MLLCSEFYFVLNQRCECVLFDKIVEADMSRNPQMGGKGKITG